ncbi:glycosyltransferase family 2 protein [Rouxiella badensis]|uniref:glycosyltransferase family 2 protein n=1 Tax=Rouxiella badensis TaxID=1646377 RepID=UPI001B60F9D8|nr:glycosyltransferase family 2 protein [Rouxiella badensis]MCC3703428.1 glycosyltransferase family 2 protein [Rouxiella badensis]MCC3731851.1 glycosyltransferase family 2 protein [Rouxiella badensis]MCC3746644.1 glycosyltransferase family 2 protein [Rouxiella badensis]MCC3757240.1 glycosyltransferase family 2 protein [Rouxiella badensis]
MRKINVILATYNGEKYVTEQIQSILLNFEHLPEYDCHILVSDDNSSDNTSAIIQRFNQQDPRIELLDNGKKGGPRENFNYLIANTDADYTFFSDQDDLWLPNKMRLFIDRFIELEQQQSGPILLHSDLCVADKNLSPVHISMFTYQNLNRNPDFAALIVSNSVTGCVMALNRELLIETQNSRISESIMHDWYIALLASSTGRISFLDNSLILYRQHGNNQVGAKSASLGDMLFGASMKKKMEQTRISVQKTRAQAQLFLDDYGQVLKSADKALLTAYIESFEKGIFSRFKLFSSHGIRKSGSVRNVFFFIFYVLGC